MTRTVMEGGGSYNRHSGQQAAAGLTAFALLDRAARSVSLAAPPTSLMIADFGSSQGQNSLKPMRIAIDALRANHGPELPVTVVHTDLPGNDFSTLFGTLETTPDSYLNLPNIYTAAVGRSFYEQLFPPDSLALGWSSYAVMWPTERASLVPGHIFSTFGGPDVIAGFDRRAEQDWARFLRLRATELQPGGRLVVVVGARDDQDRIGIEPVMDQANDTLRAMVQAGGITSEERARMGVSSHAWSRRNLLSPFDAGGSFDRLVLEHCEVSEMPDPFWAAFQANGDRQMLAAKHAGFVRAAFGPVLASGPSSSEPQARQDFLQKLEAGVHARFAADPVEIRPFVGTAVIARPA